MNRFDIDCVILWVDGNDPNWIKEKEQYLNESGDYHSSGASRFRDWGLLKYWFRGIEAYAPWIRKIHFVTWGHLPDFLKEDHPKLHIVKHSDYMPVNALPVFNSVSLEMNMYRIPGLKEHFIYCNDDMFFINPTSPEDFFHRNGKPKITYTEIPLRFKGTDNPIQRTMAANIGLINKHFTKKDIPMTTLIQRCAGKGNRIQDTIRNICAKAIYPEYYVGFKINHGIGSFCKSTYQEIWDKEPELMAALTEKRFRDPDDINQWAAIMWQLVSGNYMPSTRKELYFDAKPENVEVICKAIKGKQIHDICINDPDDMEKFEPVANRIRNAFDQILPNKCSFER